MPNAEKIERVAELTERLGASDAILLTEYRGLTVSEISELRRSLASALTCKRGSNRVRTVKHELKLRLAVVKPRTDGLHKGVSAQDDTRRPGQHVRS